MENLVRNLKSIKTKIISQKAKDQFGAKRKITNLFRSGNAWKETVLSLLIQML